MYLEDWWRHHPRKFETFANRISDLRTSRATGFEGKLFAPHLISDLTDEPWVDQLLEARTEIGKRLERRIGNSDRYEAWISDIEAHPTSLGPLDNAIAWRELEILIERDLNRQQGVLEFDVLYLEYIVSFKITYVF